jgi:hypothetical protein
MVVAFYRIYCVERHVHWIGSEATGDEEVIGAAVVKGVVRVRRGGEEGAEARAGRVWAGKRAEEVRPITAVSGWVLPSMGFR